MRLSRVLILAILTLTSLAQAGGNTSSQLLRLSVVLAKNTTEPHVTLKLYNPNKSDLEISFSDCDFVCQLRNKSTTVNFPTSKAFDFTGPCPGSLIRRTIPAKSSITVFNRRLKYDAIQLLRKTDMKVSAEFRFRYSVIHSSTLTTVTYRTTY